MSSIEAQAVSGINSVLSQESVKLFLMVLTGIFAGYTLQPVPVWLNSWFTNSVIFKFIVITVIGAVALHPLDANKLRLVLIVAALILAAFFIARVVDVVKVKA